jgi:hypothetical protein
LQKEFERKVLELTRESDGRKVLAKQQGEWMVEKNYLET